MKLYKSKFLSKRSIKVALTFALAFLTVFGMFAADAAKYAQSSVLSNGNWVKINIPSSGLYTLSRQTLKNFGFNNPNAVYVFGYGGRMISEALTTDHPDDLPPAPLVRHDDGAITFYATSTIASKPSGTGQMTFDHTINPYGDTSYYFLSDVAPTNGIASIDLSDIDGMTVNSTFTSQLVHEAELLQCASSGREYLGEDFKSNKSQTFSFDLPDNAAGNAKIRVRFAANTAGAPSSFIVSANGTRLPATSSDKIAAVTSSDQYYVATTSIKTAESINSSLDVGIEYSQGGVVKTARLDWIEVEYERNLAMKDSQLYFIVNPDTPTAYSISGATENTIVWDVTKPWDIKEIKGRFDASSKTLTIGLKESGMREFMVFDPSAKGASIPGKFKTANQDIHGLPTPHMVIITPDLFAPAAQRIADLHRANDGMTVYVLSPEKIYNEFSSGNPDISAFRKLLKIWHDRSQANPEGNQFGYCLLMGRPSYDLKGKNPETIKSGYPRTLIWQSSTGLSEPTSYCTDDFITMLEDENSDRPLPSRKQLISVGRLPVTSAFEADILASKLEDYMTNPSYGIWRNNVMMVADDGDYSQHLLQSETTIKNMMSSSAGSHVAYERVYLDAFERKQTGSGITYPDAKERMLMKWQKEGVAFISYIGHANPKEWGHEKLLTWTDINNLSNQYLPVLYAATCSFGKWDAEDVSGAELMLTNPAGGAISIITPSRTVYINKNEAISNSIAKEIFQKDSNGKGQRLGDIVRLGKNKMSSPDDNMLRFHLLGDPALRMPVACNSIQLDSINGQLAACTLDDAPVIKGRQSVKISGKVTDSDGNKVAFNGPLQFTLFDAEKSIQTYGWGDTGTETVYQDQSSKLATGSTMVKNGDWHATIFMPGEISNNFSPALLSLYAYDPILKTEANGSSSMLYVYGFDDSSVIDNEGPIIENFSVSSLSSSQSPIVNSHPVAMAIFSDESGINISDAALGHKMTLTLDSGKIFDDVSQYYNPDPEDETKGGIAYPLFDLEPGNHQLTLTVWDNAGNSSSQAIDFKVGINLRPEVFDITSFYSIERDQLEMKVTTDRALCTLQCRLECFDLSGNLIWSIDRKAYSNSDSTFSLVWDLNDSNGNRLPRGIYNLRATISAEDRLSTTHSKKIAIPAK